MGNGRPTRKAKWNKLWLTGIAVFAIAAFALLGSGIQEGEASSALMARLQVAAAGGDAEAVVTGTTRSADGASALKGPMTQKPCVAFEAWVTRTYRVLRKNSKGTTHSTRTQVVRRGRKVDETDQVTVCFDPRQAIAHSGA